MEYIADTVAIIRYVSQFNNIGKRALSILDEAENGNTKILLSVITLLEIMHLADKGRINFKLQDLLERIDNNEHYKIIYINREILLEAENIKSLEIHDRLIVATAKRLNLPLLTCDEKIKSANLIKVIWD